MKNLRVSSGMLVYDGIKAGKVLALCVQLYWPNIEIRHGGKNLFLGADTCVRVTSVAADKSVSAGFMLLGFGVGVMLYPLRAGEVSP